MGADEPPAVGSPDATPDVDELRAENERLRERLERAESELASRRQLVANVMEAEDLGRRRIAQLIHDDALQTLLAAHQELIEAAPGRVQVQRAHEVVGAAIGRLREALLSLHPVTLEQGGLEQALGAVGRQAERQGGFDVSMEIDSAALDLHDELVLAVSRELLTNAARHSQADRVTVRLARVGSELELEIADDGRGMEPDRPASALAQGHIGLASVTERVQQAGGTLDLESDPGGTRVRARVPLEA
jgi:two-component system NarL family sensor kinase